MTVIKSISLFFFLNYSFTSCIVKDKKINTAQIKTIKLTTGRDSVLSNDYEYYGDSVAQRYTKLITFLFKKYDKDTCVPMVYEKKKLRESFMGFKNLGDINNDNQNDSVFVLQPLNWCEEDAGQSYYFTDTTLPRIKSESYCCSPELFFKTADIDEDGICEVGFYYSSCASRFKSIEIYRLKNKQWELIATGEFDIMTQDPGKIKFENLVLKISKNKFQVRNFLDGEKYWKTIVIK